MPFSRATLPEEFYDITSGKLLKQPEPQYFHGLLMKRALGIAMSKLTVEGLDIRGREVPTDGEAYASAEEQRLDLDKDMIATNAITFVPELGKSPGETIRMNRPKFQDTTYTQASRRVLPSATISTTPVEVQSEQVSITLDRFAGPYDQTNTRVAPYAIDQMSANFPVHRLVDIAGMQLVRDFDKWIDFVTVSLFDNTSVKVYPKGFAVDNDLVAVDAGPMDFDTLLSAQRSLDEASIPVFPNGRRVMVLTPKQCQDLAADAQWGRYAQFDNSITGANPVYNASYIKSVAQFDVFKSQTLNKVNNSSTVPVHYGQAFGPGMVGAGMADIPEVRNSTADNYGTQALVIWLWLAGFTVLDNRFGVSVRSS